MTDLLANSGEEDENACHGLTCVGLPMADHTSSTGRAAALLMFEVLECIPSLEVLHVKPPLPVIHTCPSSVTLPKLREVELSPLEYLDPVPPPFTFPS